MSGKRVQKQKGTQKDKLWEQMEKEEPDHRKEESIVMPFKSEREGASS